MGQAWQMGASGKPRQASGKSTGMGWQPLPIERRTPGTGVSLEALRRAYVNDGERLPAALNTIWALRRAVRIWKLTSALLATVVTVESLLLLLLAVWR